MTYIWHRITVETISIVDYSCDYQLLQVVDITIKMFEGSVFQAMFETVYSPNTTDFCEMSLVYLVNVAFNKSYNSPTLNQQLRYLTCGGAWHSPRMFSIFSILSVPDECYSRHESWSLHFMSTFYWSHHTESIYGRNYDVINRCKKCVSQMTMDMFQHILFVFLFCCLYLVYPMLPVPRDCFFFIAPSVFSKVYLRLFIFFSLSFFFSSLTIQVVVY